MILGTAQLGMEYGIANTSGMPSRDQSFQILDRAYEGGVRLLDTAAEYGSSEQIIAQYNKERGHVFGICTKLPTQIEDTSSTAELTYRYAKERAEQLQVDTLDCLYLHRFEQCQTEPILAGLTRAKRSGLTKRIGVSIYHPDELAYIVDNLSETVDVVQIPLNVLSISRWVDVIDAASQAGVSLYARSVFLQGLLLMDAESEVVSRLAASEYISKIDKVANRIGVSREVLCYGAVRSLPQVEDIVVGCDNLDQLEENLDLEEKTKMLENVALKRQIGLGITKSPVTLTDPSRWDKATGRKRVGCILQARMGSSRLPGKVLEDLNGKPLIKCIVERVALSDYLDRLVVATTHQEADDLLVAFCKNESIDYFRGSELDVLDRYYACAQEYGMDVIVRLTADNPFVDASIIDSAIEMFLQNGKLDYLGIRGRVPLGLGVEVFSFAALERAWRESHDQECREHVTPYIYNNRDIFSVEIVSGDDELDNSDIRLTVDTPEDLMTARNLFAKLPDGFRCEDIVALVRSHPELLENASIDQYTLQYSGEAPAT